MAAMALCPAQRVPYAPPGVRLAKRACICYNSTVRQTPNPYRKQGARRAVRNTLMQPSDIIFIIAMVAVGLLAFAVSMYMVHLMRGKQEKSAPARAGQAPAALPDDEHKGADGVVRALRRYAAVQDYTVIAPVDLTGTKDAADLDAVLVGWFGVLGVKCLGYGGTVYGSPDEAQWVQVLNGARRSFENPMQKAQKSARAVRDVLFSAKLKSVPVETVVVFTNKGAQLNLPRSTGHYTEKTFAAYLKSDRFSEDKHIEVEPVAAALTGPRSA